MTSWRYDKSALNLIPFYEGVDSYRKVYNKNGVWLLHSISTIAKAYKYSCCETPYAEVILHISLKRIPGYYIYNVIAPCMMLSTMTVFVFHLPPEKIGLGMTNVLALILFQQLIAENMPPLGDETPVIGKIYIVCVKINKNQAKTTKN